MHTYTYICVCDLFRVIFLAKSSHVGPGTRHGPGRVHVKPDHMIEYKEFFQTLNVLPELELRGGTSPGDILLGGC